MTKGDLEKSIQYIVIESVKLKNKYTNETNAMIEFVDVFSRDAKEYQRLIKVINELGKTVYSTPTGNIYLLRKSIITVAGKLKLVKIRKPDNKLLLRGDADFNTDYPKLKKKYQSQPNFELIVREKFEMLRLSDQNFNVMSCFSNLPVRKWI